ncbi:MAG TPA: glycosyltransferase family 4 protein [Oligoflexia bacterium]|nr:glycosyltransferase family 4 protein [Oligoflexia bacterium]
MPFSSGGAESLFERLNQTFIGLGHDSDILSIPFSAEPKSNLLAQMSWWRSLSLEKVSGRKIDIVIAGKFPTYYARHSCKIVWLIHQHRQAYELVGSRYGDFASNPVDEGIRSVIINGDTKVLSEAKKIFTISDNVSKRLFDFNNLNSSPLEPPVPVASRFYEGIKGSYILSVGRLCSAKRTDLIIGALPHLPLEIKLKIVGLPDEPNYESYLLSEIRKHDLTNRVEFLGRVSEEELLKLYADCLAVYYGPYDEDYGFVTFESAKSGKPLVTTNDSGYVNDVVRKFKTGIIVKPECGEIANAFLNLRDNPELYDKYVSNARNLDHSVSWENIAETMISEALKA